MFISCSFIFIIGFHKALLYLLENIHVLLCQVACCKTVVITCGKCNKINCMRWDFPVHNTKW
ncbi:hypothetical protein MANES_17G102850v8 [Manihot esculenta]|uniref:Uncharacterized protein n=1 Tax=Manihot esculenta TaxID=3983 RepID=A0ACB7G850_MANES|nr:hypothetical protein MANES_17G102850v8 [Manihot esculenta]